MNRLNTIKKITLLYMLIYFIIAATYCTLFGTHRAGEWDDYIFPTVTLMTQHKIGISEADIPIIQEYYPEWKNEIERTGTNNLSGRYNKNGDILTWYFPTFALACIPMIMLLRFLGQPATYAFCFTNLGAVMVLLLIVYKYLQIQDKTKFMLIILLSINPIVFYYSWPSGEVLIYTFMAIGLIFWYNKWYKRAAVFISLAGTLNPTIMSVGIIMICEYAFYLRSQQSNDLSWLSLIKRNVGDIVKYGSCYIIGLIPMIYFYYNTGFINLTASYDRYTIGTETVMQRFFAYLFDLNFGILPYYPIILITGLILLAAACIQKHWRYIEWFITFAINVMLYSLMIHINSGMAGMSRYNTWGALILVFAVCLYGSELIKRITIRKIFKASIGLNALFLMLIVYHYGPVSAYNTSCITWTPIAQYVMDNFPSIYNPLHSTFNSRTINQDGGYVYKTPIIYTANDGYVRKILASSKDSDVLRNLCISLTNEDWLEKQIRKLGEKDTYISIPKKYKVITADFYNIGMELSFAGADSYNARPYVINKFELYENENWGTWTKGNQFGMRFKTQSNKEKLHGTIECDAFNGFQNYIIYVNEEKIAEGIAIGNDIKIEFDFNNPGAYKVINIKIELPDANSPKNLGQSNDSRILGLGLKKIVFTD